MIHLKNISRLPARADEDKPNDFWWITRNMLGPLLGSLLELITVLVPALRGAKAPTE